LRDKPLAQWTPDDIAQAQQVCGTYDEAGIMASHELILFPLFADSWGDSLRKSCLILGRLVKKYRVERDSSEFWDDFERLAGEAQIRFDARLAAEHKD
jgi:hypothetical protein